MTAETVSTTASTASGRPCAVVGATGQQGGATVRALLAAGLPVRALTRDPSSEAARALAGAGAQVVRADADDPESLRAAFTDVAGVYAMTTMAGPDGLDGEVRHDRAIGDAAAQAGVPHVVLSSVGGAERHTGVPHFDSRRVVEEYLAGLDVPVTFVRPTSFRENLAWMAPEEQDGEMVLRMPLPSGVAVQTVAVDDIGRVAAAVLADPSAVPGGAVEIAGDEVTGEQVAAAYADAPGRPVRYEALPPDALGDDDQQKMWTWFAKTPAYQADLELTRTLDPQVVDLATWVGQHA